MEISGSWLSSFSQAKRKCGRGESARACTAAQGGLGNAITTIKGHELRKGSKRLPVGMEHMLRCQRELCFNFYSTKCWFCVLE